MNNPIQQLIQMLLGSAFFGSPASMNPFGNVNSTQNTFGTFPGSGAGPSGSVPVTPGTGPGFGTPTSPGGGPGMA